MVFCVSDGGVAIAGDFVIGLSDRGCDCVRVQITTSLSVDETNDIAVADKLDRRLGIEFRVMSVGIEEPIIIGIFVMVASDLLLL